MNKFFIRKEARVKQFDPRDNPQQYAQDLYDMSVKRGERIRARRNAVDDHENKMRSIVENADYVSPGDRNYLDALYGRSLRLSGQIAKNDIDRYQIIGEPGSIRRHSVEENIANRRPISYVPWGERKIQAIWRALDQTRASKMNK